MIDMDLHRKRQRGVCTVNRGRGCKHKMFALVVAAPLQHVDEALYICVDVGMGMLQRITNASLRREMDDLAKAVLLEKQLCCRAICQVELHKGEIGMAFQDIEAGFFQFGM